MPQSNHDRAAEYHNLAAHAHQKAAASHQQEDHLKAHELSQQAFEHSREATARSRQTRPSFVVRLQQNSIPICFIPTDAGLFVELPAHHAGNENSCDANALRIIKRRRHDRADEQTGHDQPDDKQCHKR